MDAEINPAENIPETVLTSILQDHLGEPDAHLTNYNVAPFNNSGMSGNNSLYRVDIEWATSNSRIPDSSISWLIKCWKPGGLSLLELGWSKPVEVLAWQHGILRAESLPSGVRTPIVGAVIDPDGETAWMAVKDVSKELQEYDRAMPLSPEKLVSHAKAVLGGLARFHAFYEQPDHQKSLEGMDWLLPLENYLRRDATRITSILRKAPMDGASQGDSSDVELYLNLTAFLEWLVPSVRVKFEELLIDRDGLVDLFTSLPKTLLHGDLDDRNIGLSWLPSGEGEVILIDWEWMGMGPAALDVAKIMIYLSLLCEPGSPCPEVCWSDELPDFYYENYITACGKQLDHDAWRRSYDLGLVAQALSPLPWVGGNILRTLDGKAPLPEESIRMRLASVLQNMEHLMDRIVQAMYRCGF